MEAVAESFLVFYVFITLPPEISIILMCGVFSTQSLFQTFINVYYYCKRGSKDYSPIGHNNVMIQHEKSCYRHFVTFISICSLFCQIFGLVCVIGFLAKAAYQIPGHNRILGLAFVIPCLLMLSFSWSSLIQKWTFTPSQTSLQQALERKRSYKSHRNDYHDTTITTRWKSSKKCVQVNACDCHAKVNLLKIYFHSAETIPYLSMYCLIYYYIYHSITPVL